MARAPTCSREKSGAHDEASAQKAAALPEGARTPARTWRGPTTGSSKERRLHPLPCPLAEEGGGSGGGDAVGLNESDNGSKHDKYQARAQEGVPQRKHRTSKRGEASARTPPALPGEDSVITGVWRFCRSRHPHTHIYI